MATRPLGDPPGRLPAAPASLKLAPVAPTEVGDGPSNAAPRGHQHDAEARAALERLMDVSSDGVRGELTTERLAEIRRQIRQGKYLTDDKLDAVIDALLDTLRPR